MVKDIDLKLIIITTLICTYVVPTGLLGLSATVPKLLFVGMMALIYGLQILKTKKIKTSQLLFILLLIVLTVLSKNINYLTFFPLVMLDRLIDNKKEISEYLNKSNILYICLLFTMIYSFAFFGQGDRYAFTAIKEINQSGLAIFCLSMMFMKKNKQIGKILLIFGLLTFSRSYILAVMIYLISKIKYIKKHLLKERFIKFCNYFNLTIISSIILAFLGVFYISQYKSGNILSDYQIKNRLTEFLDYSNFFRFVAVTNTLLIFRHFPGKLLFGMTDFEYIHYGKIVAVRQAIPYKSTVPHNLFFSHLKIYGLFAIFEIYYVSKKIQKIVNKDNFFIYLAIVAYSVILGAGLYSYWLFLSIFMFVSHEVSGDVNE